jgi:glutaryl-CoA dehydrogenase (non-decarboxylating)
MDFELTDEQRLIQDTVRAFVDERVLPNAVENDINHKLDLGAIEGMADLGLLGIVIPEEYGGAGLDFVSEALACEEIERGEAAFRTLISVHVGLNSLSLLRYGTEEQKQRYLVPQAQGEKLACFGLTEPAAGSDVASMRSTARREGDVYVLNGQKNWISYASVADHQLVFAKTDPAAKHRGISAFVVERQWPGVSTRDTENKLGIWAGSTGELFFENVEVPAENLVGEEGQGFEIAMYGLDQGRFTVAAGACGVVRACLERSVEYARERETFGQAIGRYQFVQDMIAEMVRGTSRDPGARRVRLLGGVRHRALLQEREGADHLRGHNAGAQDAAGRARARLPAPQWARRRDVADRIVGAGSRRRGG